MGSFRVESYKVRLDIHRVGSAPAVTQRNHIALWPKAVRPCAGVQGCHRTCEKVGGP